ncbi:MAG TPA: DotU family type IV/VI secretion system protein, partial [Pirellulales bacterium]|nr:DotU family type IV/VI secretion system protein [Pirellulales bacterium]
VELFNTRLANEQFYLKAKDASLLPGRDALEVFYVCVVLGFRGLYRDPMVAAVLAEPRGLPVDLETWAKQTSLAIRLGQGRPPLNEGGAPGAGAPPLSGQSQVVWSSLVAAILAAFTLICGWIAFFI